jgi:ABC-type multidrug transport system fused ATPase/permease subunit
VDKVLVLKQGRVQEFGTRQELLKNKGTYYNLLKLQMELSERNT